MPLVDDFIGNPGKFLDEKVMIVPGTIDKDPEVDGKKPGVHGFTLTGSLGNAVWLEIAKPPQAIVLAYYLPWTSHGISLMQLGDEADFFFTSQLTGCRFSVLDDAEPRKPVVAHVAGDLANTKQRDTKETESKHPETGAPLAVSTRRFSVSDSRTSAGNRFAPPRIAQHRYTGSRVAIEDRTSAFVFGHRIEGVWKFFVQTTKGERLEAVKPELSDKLEILKFQDKVLLTV